MMSVVVWFEQRMSWPQQRRLCLPDVTTSSSPRSKWNCCHCWRLCGQSAAACCCVRIMQEECRQFVFSVKSLNFLLCGLTLDILLLSISQQAFLSYFLSFLFLSFFQFLFLFYFFPFSSVVLHDIIPLSFHVSFFLCFFLSFPPNLFFPFLNRILHPAVQGKQLP